MSTVDNMEDCKQCKGLDSLYSSFNCRSFEEYKICQECGYHYNYFIKKDENGKYLLAEVKYPVSGSSLVSVASDGRELCRLDLSDSTSTDDVDKWFNGPVKESGEGVVHSVKIFTKKEWQDRISRNTTIEEEDGFKILVTRWPRYKEEEKLGAGVLALCTENGAIQMSSFDRDNMPNEDEMEEMKGLVQKYGGFLKIWDEEKNLVKIIIEREPPKTQRLSKKISFGCICGGEITEVTNEEKFKCDKCDNPIPNDTEEMNQKRSKS